MSSAAKKAKWLNELNEEPDMPFKYPTDNSSHVLCLYCEKSFLGTQKSMLTQHLNAEKHKTNKQLKQKRKAHQSTLEETLGPKPKHP